ncbi:uncharacterized protein LOC117539569 isoform X2 [Gymnodraco acuticeps]|uniref:Uncharacterized protein LOC117537280 isoform X2 n=1 Tax=Gymnodraco acuticeps TaxID=8218 RepID=A0A6P8TCU2_GYMAC|nr:uncharacterized protein LOC117537280 isoform X2 [Gymnodraco acuticeps]XP_034061673.1 uncharacterized protein LOC117539569 isoform X2 [Gymnodraco acuticeps]
MLQMCIFQQECNTFATTLRLIQWHTVIVGIVNENHHWMLVVMYPHEKKTLFLDPLGEGKGKTKVCLQSTRAFMRMKGCKVSRWTCSTLPHNRQQDSTSCGVLALKFETSQKAVHELRLDIATSLLRESDDLSRLCFYCGMEEQDEEHWICCDICQQWYHHQCVQRPPVDQPYLCPGCT